MKSTRCKNWFSREIAETMGEALGVAITTHEIEEHNGDSECKEARVELTALLIHIMKIGPEELDLVKERLLEHLKICRCREGLNK